MGVCCGAPSDISKAQKATVPAKEVLAAIIAAESGNDTQNGIVCKEAEVDDINEIAKHKLAEAEIALNKA